MCLVYHDKIGKAIRMYKNWWVNTTAGGRVSTVSPGPGACGGVGDMMVTELLQGITVLL